MLTKEQLLQPRYLCTGTLGKILMPGYTFAHGNIVEPDEAYPKWFFDDFPHLFKPLPWWYGRTVEDLPKYVKFSEDYMDYKAGSIYKTEHWSEKHYDCCQFISDEGLCGVPFGKWLFPATEQEYWDSKPLRKFPDCGSEWKGNDSCPECFPI